MSKVLSDLPVGELVGLAFSGAGGGGYLILVSDQPIEKAIRIHIRRQSD